MSDAAMFRATVHSLRTVPSRKIVQLVLELPIEELSRVAQIAEHGAWVAVCRLIENSEELSIAPSDEEGRADGASQAGEKPAPKSLAQKAGAMCADPLFQRYIGADGSHECANLVRKICKINSRRELGGGGLPDAAWRDLVERFRGWQVAERCGVTS